MSDTDPNKGLPAKAQVQFDCHGQAVGKALYDATGGGGRMDKFIDAEPKIRELVNELFPSNFPAMTGNREMITDKATVSDSDKRNANQIESKPDLYDELKKLAELRDEGILTEDEFAAEKKELLDNN